jgi:anaerobic selenocysteine-containing dehydrogenase
MIVTRRNFLKDPGLLAAMAATSGGLAAFPKLGFAHGGQRTAEEIIKSTWVHCVNFLGIEVHKAGNRIRSIVLDSGCRDYYNHGICPKGVSCGLITYTPYRVQGAVEAY